MEVVIEVAQENATAPWCVVKVQQCGEVVIRERQYTRLRLCGGVKYVNKKICTELSFVINAGNQ